MKTIEKSAKSLAFALVLSLALATGSCSSAKKGLPLNLPDEEIRINFDQPDETPVYEAEKSFPKEYEEYTDYDIDMQKGEKPDICETARNYFEKNTKTPSENRHSIVEYSFSDGWIYTILTGTNMVTDLRLEEGEIPSGEIAIGNTDSYMIESAMSKEKGKDVFHLFIRAMSGDGWTTMIIPTDRRTYYFKLVSTDGMGMFGVRFRYGGGIISKGIAKPEKKLTDLKNLCFEYTISGDGSISPAVVFSDDKSTYFQFPVSYINTDTSPALYIQSGEGMSITNYTIRGNLYICDFLLNDSENFLFIYGKRKATVKRNR